MTVENSRGIESQSRLAVPNEKTAGEDSIGAKVAQKSMDDPDFDFLAHVEGMQIDYDNAVCESCD